MTKRSDPKPEAGVKVKLEELTAGDVVHVDAGFTCMPESQRVVNRDDSGELFVWCTEQGQISKHYLSGQVADDGYLVGVTAVGHKVPM